MYESNFELNKRLDNYYNQLQKYCTDNSLNKSYFKVCESINNNYQITERILLFVKNEIEKKIVNELNFNLVIIDNELKTITSNKRDYLIATYMNDCRDVFTDYFSDFDNIKIDFINKSIKIDLNLILEVFNIRICNFEYRRNTFIDIFQLNKIECEKDYEILFGELSFNSILGAFSDYLVFEYCNFLINNDFKSDITNLNQNKQLQQKKTTQKSPKILNENLDNLFDRLKINELQDCSKNDFNKLFNGADISNLQLNWKGSIGLLKNLFLELHKIYQFENATYYKNSFQYSKEQYNNNKSSNKDKKRTIELLN